MDARAGGHVNRTVMDMWCPFCNERVDTHDSAGRSHTPHPGAITICALCTEVGVYDRFMGGLALRKPTPPEREAIEASENVQLIRAKLRALHAWLGQVND